MDGILFESLKIKVIGLLKANLTPHLHYHSSDHTIRVLSKSIEIAAFEGVSGRQLLLLKLAALFHDTGFLYSVHNHEQESCRIADKMLADYDLTEEELFRIRGMIMATKLPQIITNKLEAILADADLEYLGTDDFFEISKQLYLEMLHRNPELTHMEFDKIQITFLEGHHYFTAFAQLILAPTKAQNLEIIRKRYQKAMAEQER